MEEEGEDLYEEIQKILDSSKSHYKIVMGDFNAKEEPSRAVTRKWETLDLAKETREERS